jgi:hypothetical protein
MYPDVGSADAMAVLRAIGTILYPGIAHIEARHAAIRRIKLAKSSTWSVSLGILSAHFTLLRHRRSLEIFCATAPTTKVARPAGRKIGKIELRRKESGKVNWRQRKAKRQGWLKSHGGGAWRIFVSRRLMGKGKANSLVLRRLGQEYRNLDEDVKAQLVEQGQRATLAWRHTKARRMKLALQPIDSRHDGAMMPRRSSQDRQVFSTVLESLVSDIRKDRAEARQKHALETAELHEKLAEWRKGEVARQGAMASFAPSDRREDLVDQPHSVDLRHAIVRFPTAELAEEFLGRASDSLRAGLRDTWDARQKIYRHANAPKLGRSPRASSLCVEAGMCLHSDMGVKVAAMEVSLVQELQQAMPPKTLQRQALKQAHVVLRISDGEKTHWLHVSHANLSSGSWRLAVVPLTEVAKIGLPQGFVALRRPFGARWSFLWQAMTSFALEKEHTLQVFTVVSNEAEPLVQFRPCEVCVHRFLDDESVLKPHRFAVGAPRARADGGDGRRDHEQELLAIQDARPVEPEEEDEASHDPFGEDAESEDDHELPADDEEAVEDEILVAALPREEEGDEALPEEPEAAEHAIAVDAGAPPAEAEAPPAAAAPADIPVAMPPPHVGGPGWAAHAGAGGPWTRWTVRDDEGNPLGQLVLDDGSTTKRKPSVSAHCKLHKGRCILFKTLNPGKPGTAQGKPLGL